MSVKQNAINKAAEWRRALAEGRVVRYHGGMTFTSYPTVAGAEAFLATLRTEHGDATAEIVRVSA